MTPLQCAARLDAVKVNISLRIFTWFFYCKSNLVLPTKHAGIFFKSLLTFRIVVKNLIQASMSHETTDINKTQRELLLFPLVHLWNTDIIILYRPISQQSIYLLIFKYVFIWLIRLFSRLIVPAFCPEWLLNMNNLTNCLFIVVVQKNSSIASAVMLLCYRYFNNLTNNSYNYLTCYFFLLILNGEFGVNWSK